MQQRDARRDGVKLTAFDDAEAQGRGPVLAETASIACYRLVEKKKVVRSRQISPDSFNIIFPFSFQNYYLRTKKKKKKNQETRNAVVGGIFERIDVPATRLAMALDSERL